MLEIEIWHLVMGGVAIILGPPGAMAAVIGVKLNGHLDKIDSTDKVVKEIQEFIYDVDRRVIVLETKEEVASSP